MQGLSARIFLSYRREETRHLAGRLADRIKIHFGLNNVFMDVDTIEPGADFHSAIVHAVSSCAILLALIGPHWLEITDRAGRRQLDDPDDFVVLEIGTALDRGAVVIPILVDGAQMPAKKDLPAAITSLAGRNAIRLDHESFTSDSERLLRAIEHALQSRVQSASAAPRQRHLHQSPGLGQRTPLVDKTERLPRVDVRQAQPPERPQAIPVSVKNRAIPIYRHVLRSVLWCLTYSLTILTSVGFGLSFAPNSKTGIGASIVVVVIVGLGIVGLLALVRGEIARERRLVQQAAEKQNSYRPEGADIRPISQTRIKILHIGLAGVAVLFLALSLLFP